MRDTLRHFTFRTPVSGFPPTAPTLITYEQRLNSDGRYALAEGSQYFEENSAVQRTLRKIAKRLDELGIAYSVVGGLALFTHGYRRFTEDVDILVTAEGLRRIHDALEGLGYVPPFTGSKHLRDVESGVKIEFLITGQFPGDGKPKPVSFPDPATVFIERDGIKYLGLPSLVELKLASGMTNLQRAKDLSDVMELIRTLDLPREFADQLSPFVQQKYIEQWNVARPTAKRYLTLWRNKFLTIDAKSIDDMIATLRSAAETLAAMRADGVTLDEEGGTGDDYAYLVTTDPAIAKKYDMHDEAEFWGDDVDSEDESENEDKLG